MVALQRTILMMGGTAAFLLPFTLNLTNPILSFLAGFIGGAAGFHLWKTAIRMRSDDDEN